MLAMYRAFLDHPDEEKLCVYLRFLYIFSDSFTAWSALLEQVEVPLLPAASRHLKEPIAKPPLSQLKKTQMHL